MKFYQFHYDFPYISEQIVNMVNKLAEHPALNIDSLLQVMPDRYLILNSKFEIVAVSDAYAKATKITLD